MKGYDTKKNVDPDTNAEDSFRHVSYSNTLVTMIEK